ncbi:DUF2691 family protein [Butyrivibrio sp. M55]|uniref:DUF2691 family protein n=1 Tax=Butyrivibrio sp. M55 TaxID=1855323 RepID=UPI0008F367E1|nr:DUF2691 family protein [Butyrivibrio sp. M55]SFU33226.1 Protein of unknown function [Butyrivibrio sp. M55]
MLGIVINKGENYYTDIKDILNTIGDLYKKYKWLISGYECYPQDEKLAKLFSGKAVFISSVDLKNVLDIENFQLIWGVLSAIPQNISKEEVMKYKLPYAESNNEIWDESYPMQHPLADIEIIGWDSSATVIKSKDDSIIRMVKAKKGQAISLNEYNSSSNA